MKIMTRVITAAALSSALAFTAAAAPPPALTPIPVQAEAQHPAHALVQQASESMVASLRANRAELQRNPDRIYDLLQQNILPHFDFNAISKSVLGRHWNAATDAQKERFTAAFTNFAVRRYASAMLSYSDFRVTTLTPRSPGADRAVIQTKIEREGSPAIRVDYHLSRDAATNRWKISDVAVEGISLTMTMRSEYNSVIGREGVESLINKLEQLNRAAAPLTAPAPGR